MSKRQLYYDWGYEDGKRAERERIKRAIDGNPPAGDTSLLGSIGICLVLVFLWWCITKALTWMMGSSENFLTQLAYQILFWGGWICVGFLAIVIIIMEITEAVERQKAKNHPQKPADDPNLPFYKKYPPADVIKEQKK